MLATYTVLIVASTQPQSWRDFRARLVTRTAGADVPQTAATTPESAQLNSASLKQRMTLAKKSGSGWHSLKVDEQSAWAHPTVLPEAGGLLCAAPLQAQLVHQLRTDADAQSSPWAVELGRRLDASLDDEQLQQRDRWLEKTPYLYSLATTMANEAFKTMGLSLKASTAQAAKGLWEAQQRALSIRLRVCLVLHVDEGGALCTGLSLSQPLASPWSKDAKLEVARQLLYGSPGEVADSATDEGGDDSAAARFVAAFGEAFVIYKGGPDGLDQPGTCVHGLPGRVDSSTELAPDTGIYLAPIESATEAVLDGRAPPEAFRFFAGWHEGISVADGAWIAAACSSSLVLRQSGGLITPLWHEVLDLCGGEYAEMSAAVKVENSGGSGASRRRSDADNNPRFRRDRPTT